MDCQCGCADYSPEDKVSSTISETDNRTYNQEYRTRWNRNNPNIEAFQNPT